MKKTAFMIVYNDADYVEQAINSVKDWVDEMIIVEGAFQITLDAGGQPRSDDGTCDILNKFRGPKVKVVHRNLQEHKDHYNVGYQYAVENGSDWAVLIDSDEVWQKKDRVFADSWMKSSAAKEIRISETCFINDFKTWYPGTYPRIFRCEKGAKFVFDNEVRFSEGRGQHKLFEIPKAQVNVFHYGYVRRQKRWKLKQDYMWEKDKNPGLKEYGLDENKYIIPSDIPIFEFKGNHPESMRSHPFHDLTAEEIIYG